MGIINCGQLQLKSLVFLKHEFGPKLGQSLYNYCRGIDDREINFEQERKSISAEVNYGIRFNDNEDMERFVGQLSEEVAMRMVKAGNLKGKQITLKIMVRSANAPEETAKFLGHGLCDSHSKGCTLAMPTNDHSVIKRETLLLMKMLKVEAKNLRGIGIQVAKLEKPHVNDLKGQNKSILNFLAKKGPSTSTSGSNGADPNIPVSPGFAIPGPSGTSTPNTSGISRPGPSRTSTPIAGPSTFASPGPSLRPGPSRTSTPVAGPSTYASPGPSSRPGPSSTPNTSNNPYGQEFDDIDEEILKELPEDIRQEIERERAKNNRNKAKQNLKQQDLSFSQFDQSVLEALPQDLLKELQNEYKKPEPKPEVKKSAFDMLMAKKSPVPVKSKRGRKPKKSARIIPRKIFSDDEPEDEDIDPFPPEDPEVPELTLNGKSDLKYVRQLLKTWIATCPSPRKEDMMQIVDFLKRKLMNNDDEYVYLLLKTFYRLCHENADNLNWIEIYQQVTTRIQDFFKSKHNGKNLRMPKF